MVSISGAPQMCHSSYLRVKFVKELGFDVFRMILERLGVQNFKKLTIVAWQLYPVMDNRSLFETRWDHQMTGNSVILSLFPKITQLRTAVTLCLLNRFQSSWYLWCLTRADTPENSIYNRILWVLPTHRVANVKRISGNLKVVWFSGKETKMSLSSIIWWSHLVSNTDPLSITGYSFEATMVSFF